MTLELFVQQFVDTKKPMSRSVAVDYIKDLLGSEFPIQPEQRGRHRLGYIQRICQRTVCMIVIDAIENAPPWVDYREIFATLEWPYMRRLAEHAMENAYDGLNGEKIREADAWFAQMWSAFHDVFSEMPESIPENKSWRIYDVMMEDILKNTKKYRRLL